MKRLSLIILALLTLLPGCVDNKELVRDAASKYWQKLIDGRFEEAYAMLCLESKDRIAFSDYSQNKFSEAANPFQTKSRQKLWSQKVSFVVGKVEQKGNRADVELVFSVPDLDELYTMIEKRAGKRLKRKAKDDDVKLMEYYKEIMEKEIRKGNFTHKTFYDHISLIKEKGSWKIDY